MAQKWGGGGEGEAGWELHFFLLAPRSDSATYDT